MGIEVEELQSKGIYNIFNKIIIENITNLKKVFPIQVWEASRTQNRLDQNRTSLQHIIIKTISTENRERVLNNVREKKITCKVKPMKITVDFLIKTLIARRAWSEVFRTLNENNFNPRILYTAKLSFKIDRIIKIFHDKQKLKQHMISKPPLQKMLQEILHTEDEHKQNHQRGWEVSNHREER
jgi:hypothetical protein